MKNTIRLIVVGAPKSGKTKLIETINKKLNYKLIHKGSEVARNIWARYHTQSIDEIRLDTEKINTIQWEILKTELEKQQEQTESFISDAGWGNIVYMARFCTCYGDALQSEEWKVLMDIAHDPTTINIWCRPNKMFLDIQDSTDINRAKGDTSWDSMIEFDAILGALIQQYKIPVLNLHMPTMVERVNQVIYVIDKLKYGLDIQK